MKDSFAELIRLDTLKAAVNYLLDDRKDDFVPDSVGHQDFFYNLDGYLLGLSQRLKDGLYRPHPLLEIDVPKTGLAMRPGSILHFEDRVVLFAIAHVLAPRLDKLLPQNVYHFRTKPATERKKGLFEIGQPVLLPRQQRRHIRTFTDWYEAWPDFRAAASASYEKEGYEFLVEADVASYFENINHELLKQLLTSKLGAHLKIVNLLFMILSQWSQSSLYGLQPGRGIPQGNEVSSWLGTLYLVDLDREMARFKRKHPIKYLRYVDDILVFTKKRAVAREVVHKINHILRRLHLNMQTSKLEIIEKDEFESHLGTKALTTISALVDSIEQLGKEEHAKRYAVRRQLSALYDTYIGDTPLLGKLQLRMFKRLLTGFMRLRDPSIVEKVWPILIEHPAITDKALRYFQLFKEDKDIPHRLLDLINNSDQLSEWQLASFIGVLRYCWYLPNDIRPIIKRISRQMNRHWSVRMQAHGVLLHLPWQPSSDDRWCNRAYKRETHPQVRKVILLQVFRCLGAFRNKFMGQTLYDDDPETTRFRKYLHALLNQPDLARRQLGLLMRDTLRLDDYLWICYVLLETKDHDVLNRLARLVEVKLKTYRDGNIAERLREVESQVTTILAKHAQSLHN